MDNPSDTTGSDGKNQRRFWARLLVVTSLIGRLVNLVRVTENDLMEAGVYLRRTGD